METTTLLNKNEKYDGEFNIYIVGVLRSFRGELEIPTQLRYFKHPNKCDYPMRLDDDNYTHRLLDGVSVSVSRMENFLCRSFVSENLKPRILNKFKIWTQRGVLARFMMGLSAKAPINFLVSKFDENLCMTLKYEHRNKGNSSKEHWRFVQHIFSESTTCKPNTKQEIFEDDQYYALFHSQIGDYDLIYTGEVTGVDSKEDVKNIYDAKELNSLKFILTKTVKENGLNIKKRRSYFLFLYCQAYLANVNDIYFGIKEHRFVDTDCVIRQEIIHMHRDHILETLNVKKEKLLGSLYAWLKLVEQIMSGINNPYTTCEVTSDPLTSSVKYRIYDGKTDQSFVSEDLKNYCEKF